MAENGPSYDAYTFGSDIDGGDGIHTAVYHSMCGKSFLKLDNGMTFRMVSNAISAHHRACTPIAATFYISLPVGSLAIAYGYTHGHDDYVAAATEIAAQPIIAGDVPSYAFRRTNINRARQITALLEAVREENVAGNFDAIGIASYDIATYIRTINTAIDEARS